MARRKDNAPESAPKEGGWGAVPRRASVLKSASAISSGASIVTVAPTIANLLEKGGGPADLARLVKAIRDLYIAFGEDMPSEYRSDKTMPVPVAIVNAVIDLLNRTTEKARAARTKRPQKERLLRDEFIKKGHSKLNASKLAAEKLYSYAGKSEIERATERIRKL
jgi:hypothetical protein